VEIGFDFDDTLVDLCGPLLKFWNKSLGKEFSKENFITHRHDEILQISKEKVISGFLDFDRTPEAQNLPVIAGAREFLVLLKELGHKVIIITSRPEQIAPQTWKMVNCYFPELVADMHFCTSIGVEGEIVSKAQICLSRNIRIMFEDRADHAKKCTNKGIHVGLFHQPWNWHETFPDTENLVTRVLAWDHATPRELVDRVN